MESREQNERNSAGVLGLFSRAEVERAVEAALFVGALPLEPGAFAKTMPNVPTSWVLGCLEHIADRYRRELRPYRVIRAADGYRLLLTPSIETWLRDRPTSERTGKLSGAALKVLSVIAYRQPIDRPALERMVGVDSGNVLRQLIRRNLIETVANSDGDAKRNPNFVTTAAFLEAVGVKTIEELPRLEDL